MIRVINLYASINNDKRGIYNLNKICLNDYLEKIKRDHLKEKTTKLEKLMLQRELLLDQKDMLVAGNPIHILRKIIFSHP